MTRTCTFDHIDRVQMLATCSTTTTNWRNGCSNLQCSFCTHL